MQTKRRTIVKRDPEAGYYSSDLWIPKTHVNVDGMKTILTLPIVEKKRGGGDVKETFVTAYRETKHHLIVPRAFFDLSTLDDFPIYDVRPQSYPRANITSSIVLDARSPNETVQRDSVAAMLAAPGGLLQLACGKGKAQPVSTRIPTPTGWRHMGDLRVGDRVFGSNGLPTVVTGVFPQGTLPVFRVTMEDSTSTRCCDNHLWFTQTPNDRRSTRKRTGPVGKVRATSEIRRSVRTKAGARHAVPRSVAIQYPRQVPVFHAWAMGVYLGDGSATLRGTSRCVSVTKGNVRLLQKMRRSLRTHGVESAVFTDGPCPYLRVRFERNKANAFWDELVESELVGVHSTEKFIPRRYMTASIGERWDLLQGLLDTDGSIVPTARTFSTSSPRLRDDVTELARSLGIRVSVEPRQTHYTYKGVKKAGAPSWRLYMNHEKWGKGRYNDYQYIQSVEPDGEEECVCISVAAKDKLYVTEDFILTHNTVIALDVAVKIGGNILIVVETSELIRQWRGEITEWLDFDGEIGLIGQGAKNWRHPVVIATYHSLAKLADDPPPGFTDWFATVIFDEAHHLGARTFIRAAGILPCRRYGLSATPDRADGMTKLYMSFIGGILFRDLKPDLQPEAVFYSTGVGIDTTDQVEMSSILDASRSINFNYLAASLGRKPKRIALITNLLRQARVFGRRILVLSHSIETLVNLFFAWNGSTERLSDVPRPTPEELGLTVPPRELAETEYKRIGLIHTDLRERLEGKLPENERRALERDLHQVARQLEMHEAAVALEKEWTRRYSDLVKRVLRQASPDAGLLIGDAKPKDRENTVKNKAIIFSIMKYGKEALNQPFLDTVIGCEPVGQEGGVRQLMGRALRKKLGKLQPVVVFLEDHLGFLIGMGKKLRKFLKNNPEDAGGPIPYRTVIHEPDMNIWQQFDRRAE